MHPLSSPCPSRWPVLTFPQSPSLAPASPSAATGRAVAAVALLTLLFCAAMVMPPMPPMAMPPMDMPPMSMSMQMTFTMSYRLTLWWSGWKTESIGAYLATLALLFLLTVTQEGVHGWRASLPGDTPKALALYGLNALLSYMLMLAVMTYNGGVLIVVVAGMVVRCPAPAGHCSQSHSPPFPAGGARADAHAGVERPPSPRPPLRRRERGGARGGGAAGRSGGDERRLLQPGRAAYLGIARQQNRLRICLVALLRHRARAHQQSRAESHHLQAAPQGAPLPG